MNVLRAGLVALLLATPALAVPTAEQIVAYCIHAPSDSVKSVQRHPQFSTLSLGVQTKQDQLVYTITGTTKKGASWKDLYGAPFTGQHEFSMTVIDNVPFGPSYNDFVVGHVTADPQTGAGELRFAGTGEQYVLFSQPSPSLDVALYSFSQWAEKSER